MWPEVRIGQALGPSKHEDPRDHAPVSMAALSPPKPWAPEVAQSQVIWEGFLEEEQVGREEEQWGQGRPERKGSHLENRCQGLWLPAAG